MEPCATTQQNRLERVTGYKRSLLHGKSFGRTPAPRDPWPLLSHPATPPSPFPRQQPHHYLCHPRRIGQTGTWTQGEISTRDQSALSLRIRVWSLDWTWARVIYVCIFLVDYFYSSIPDQTITKEVCPSFVPLNLTYRTLNSCLA